jgi:Tfp pilus assembly protein PilX
MAMLVTLILALVVGGIAQVVVADLNMGRMTRWDVTALYLAEAAIEHQMYLLKASKDAGAVPYTNYPITDQQGWYTTSLACLLNCPATPVPSARRWRVQATGELRRYNPDSTYTVLQTRTLVAEVDITYGGSAPLYGTPLQVTIRRWEEALP